MQKHFTRWIPNPALMRSKFNSGKVQEVQSRLQVQRDETSELDCNKERRYLKKEELEAHYSYMAKILRQHICFENDDINSTPDSSNICTNDNQLIKMLQKCDDRDALANKLWIWKENKTIFKAIKESKRIIDSRNWKMCKTRPDETNSAIGEAISCRDKLLIALQNKQNELRSTKL
ncbi:hypothetical protein Tco_0993997 [Tanacetum coccineum]